MQSDGSVTPHANSSDTTIPTFTASDSNVRTGGIIGTIHGTLGTPDTIGGTTTTFSYAIKPGGDGGMFQVNSGTGVIKSNANLNRHVRERMYGYVEKNYYCMYDLDECRINWLSPLSYKYKCRNYGIGGSSDR